MLLALMLSAQVAGGVTLATCHVPDDARQRTWQLVQRGEQIVVVFRSRALDRPHVELRLPGAIPATTTDGLQVSFKSGNGGRSVEWRIAKQESRLDLYVNHGLEVNVEADLDPAVDLMNTDGTIDVTCDAAQSNAQGSPVRPLGAEWTVAIGAARSVNLFQSTSGRAYAVQTIGWGRELAKEWGPGVLRGRFVWSVEAMPVFAQFSPSAIYGIGIAPVVWRWNFVPQPKWSAFAELAMGGMWSTEPIPERTSRGNFIAHWGGGVRLLPRGPHSLLVGYRFQHFSNGNQLGSNPGVNAHVVLLGWSHRS